MRCTGGKKKQKVKHESEAIKRSELFWRQINWFRCKAQIINIGIGCWLIFFPSTLQSFKVLWEISTPFHLLFVIINRPTIQKTILFGFTLELFYKAPFRVLVFWVGAPVCWSEMKNALLFPFFPAFSTLTDLMLLKHYCFSPVTIHLSIQSIVDLPEHINPCFFLWITAQVNEQFSFTLIISLK